MPPLAHHGGEDSILAFLLTLSGSGLSVLAAVGRERATALGARLLRRGQPDRQSSPQS